MTDRENVSNRGDPKKIGSDKFQAFTFALLAQPVNTLLPFLNLVNGDSVTHTFTLTLRSGGGAAVTTSFTVQAGQIVALPTIAIAAIACDSAGTGSSVAGFYSDIAPASFRAPSLTGLSGKSFVSTARAPAGQANELMLGLGQGAAGTAWVFTPNSTGVLFVTVSGTMAGAATAASAASGTLSLYFGTGGAPAAGAGLTGTQSAGSSALNYVNVAATLNSLQVPFTISLIIPGFVVGTTYWFDLGTFISAGWNTLGVVGTVITIAEYPS